MSSTPSSSSQPPPPPPPPNNNDENSIEVDDLPTIINNEDTDSSSSPVEGTPVEGTPSTAPSFQPLSWLKHEDCKVCGDRANGFHYGVMTCEGCKAFFRRNKGKPPTGLCAKHGKCEVTAKTRNCQPCRFKKCLEAGMTGNGSEKHVFRRQYSPAVTANTRNTIIRGILVAHQQSCEYTRSKLEKLVIWDFPWKPEKTSDGSPDRLRAWMQYSKEIDRDITSAGAFIRHLQDNLLPDTRASLLKMHAFKMHLIRIAPVLNRQGLQLPDGRLISLEFLKALYGNELAEEMVKFTYTLMNEFRLDDDDLAMLLTLVYYSKLSEEDILEYKIEDQEELDKLAHNYGAMFYEWYEDRGKQKDRYLSFQVLLNKLKDLDRLHNSDVKVFLKQHFKYFNEDCVFGAIYLNNDEVEEVQQVVEEDNDHSEADS